ncbi:MAG: cupin domain-containing protein [Alphaproteobacteria bacterium]
MSTPLQISLADDGTVPNSPLPLLVYEAALADRAAGAVQDLFAANGWPGGWVNGVFTHHHYHSTAHEVLGVISGWAEVLFGGPAGKRLRVEAGDVVVVPAGVAHCNVGQGDGFSCVGAYPAGQHPDHCRDTGADRDDALANIAAVPLPAQDPVHGSKGPLLEAWGG